MAKVLQKCAMTCPECGGHNVDLYEDNKEVRTSANLNPLHPFTLVNHKEVEKKKLDGRKVAAAVATGGMSLLFTHGLKSKVKRQWYCKDCGCIFEE